MLRSRLGCDPTHVQVVWPESVVVEGKSFVADCLRLTSLSDTRWESLPVVVDAFIVFDSLSHTPSPCVACMLWT